MSTALSLLACDMAKQRERNPCHERSLITSFEGTSGWGDLLRLWRSIDLKEASAGFPSLARKCDSVARTLRKQVLISARALIADPARWTTGALARDADGSQVEWNGQSASKWCATGAIYRAVYDLVAGAKEAERIGNDIAESFRPSHWPRKGGLSFINDGLGHVAVLAVLSRAVQAADPHRKARRLREAS